jgi:hypothetical protein
LSQRGHARIFKSSKVMPDILSHHLTGLCDLCHSERSWPGMMLDRSKAQRSEP